MATERSIANTQIEVECSFNTTYFVSKEELSYKKYPQICNLQCKKNIELGKNYLTDVACKRFILSIGENFKNNLKRYDSIKTCQ